MSKPRTINVDGVEYIRADSMPHPPSAMQIVVADRGWVFVGITVYEESGVTLLNAKCIRIWGTDSSKPGLGWLALHGPTPKTKLDDSGTVRIPTHSVIATFDTRAELWT